MDLILGGSLNGAAAQVMYGLEGRRKDVPMILPVVAGLKEIVAKERGNGPCGHNRRPAPAETPVSSTGGAPKILRRRDFSRSFPKKVIECCKWFEISVGCGSSQVKMGKLLAKAVRTSEVRIVQKTKEFVSPIKEVLIDGTSTWYQIASSDALFFGETLYRDGQSAEQVCGRDDLRDSGPGISSFE